MYHECIIIFKRMTRDYNYSTMICYGEFSGKLVFILKTDTQKIMDNYTHYQWINPNFILILF